MIPIKFKEQTAIIAEHQEGFMPLPAHIGIQGLVTCCWELSFIERVQVLFSGVIWHQIRTHNNPLQPQKLSIMSPFED